MRLGDFGHRRQGPASFAPLERTQIARTRQTVSLGLSAASALAGGARRSAPTTGPPIAMRADPERMRRQLAARASIARPGVCS